MTERQRRSFPARMDGLQLALGFVEAFCTERGVVGVTMRDNSLLSAGPNSILSLQRFEFDATTSQGRFDTQLQRGTLAVVSGRIAKQSPEAMTVRTPSAQLAVRGTDFVVAAGE